MNLKLTIKKTLIFLTALTITGLPFVLMHKPANPYLVNLVCLSIAGLIYLTCINDLKKIKFTYASIIAGLIAVFGLIRFKILPPPELQVYDLWLLALGLFLLFDKCELKYLLKFTLLLLFPLTIFHLYNLPISIKGSGLLLIGGFLFSWIPELKGRLLTKEAVLWGIIGTIAFTLLSCQLLIFDPGIKKRGRVLFDSGHQSTEDVRGEYTTNLAKSIIYGHANLARFLKKAGYKISITTIPLSPKSLKNQDILVMLMSSKIYHPPEVSAVKEFVKNGGGLLVIADHSNIDNTMASFNPIIEDFGIRLRFDTIWLRATSRKDLIYLRHPLIWDMERVSPSVGASLDLSKSARAILKAGYDNYSDIGDANNIQMAYLGNSQLDKNEQIGDIILGAVAEYGHGRVLVLPDSAYFQNTSLYRSFDFAYRVFDWLNRSNSLSYWYLLISLPFLVLLLIGLVVTGGRVIITLPYSFGLAMVLALIISAILNLQFYPKPDFKFLGHNRVLFDMAHNPQHTTYWSKRAHSKTGIDSLIQQVTRLDMYPFIKEKGKISFMELKDYLIYIIVAPNTRYSRAEIEAIKRYVEAGGRLLVVDGPREYRVVDPLLQEFGCEIDKHPLAMHEPIRAMGDLAIQVPFGQFWASQIYHPLTDNVTSLQFVNPCEVRGGLRVADVGHRSVILSKEWKKGKIVIVGDDQFFANYISETETEVIDPIKLQACWDILMYLRS